ncbi:MAG TPA: PAS domain S-box protein [Cyclobacteriaceae bacterium]|nr:PAS domain S-box protein [Cyclobacteriaceae bacterium]
MCISCFAVVTIYIFKYLIDPSDRSNIVDRTNNVIIVSDQLVSTLKDTRTNARNYLITDNESFLKSFTKDVSLIDQHLALLKRLTRNSQFQKIRVDSLEFEITKIVSFNKELITLKQSADINKARNSINTQSDEVLMDKVRLLQNEIQNEENLSLQKPKDKKQSSIGNMNWLMAFFMMIVVFIMTLEYLNNRISTSARSKTEDDLQKSKWFSTTLSSIGDAVIATDNQGNVTFMNPVAQSLTGWEEEDAKGISLDIIFDIINEETRNTVESPVRKVLQHGKVVGLANHTLLIRKDKSEIPIDDSAAPIMDSNGKIEGVVLVFRDVTEQKKNGIALKESEEKFQKAFQASAAGISITRISDATYHEVNDTFTQLTGYTKEELIGHSSSELNMIASINKREEVLQQVRDHGSAKDFELTVRQKSGKIIEVLASVETIVWRNEKYAINIIYDITERKKAETDLAFANKELESFSYSVSHDLRSPLRSIIGYSKILEEDHRDTLNDEGKRVLDIIRRNSLKMNSLIDDLLLFSKLGRKEIQKSEIDTETLVHQVLAEIKQANFYRANVTTKSLLPICADPALFTQVWMNLISNALKYSGNKENPTIEIGSHEEENEVVYSIKDNGAGFDMQYADKLFGVFQRLHKAQEFEGTGIGLSIVKRIVMRHGGRVWAEGKINEGATFYFSLPLKA